MKFISDNIQILCTAEYTTDKGIEMVEGPKQTPYAPDESWLTLFNECWGEEQHKQQLADYQRTERNDQMREGTLIYEDELPEDISQEDYDDFYKNSTVDFVRYRIIKKDYSTFPLPYELKAILKKEDEDG